MPSKPPRSVAALCVLALALSACGSAAERPSPSPAAPSPPSAPTSAPTTAVAPQLDPERAVAVARGSGFACALRANGRVACWGANAGGELGQGHTDPVEGAHEVVGLDDAVALAAAQRVACVARRTGAVVCWGSARSGELGDARETSSGGRLVTIPGVEGADAVFGWLTRVCARTPRGTWCWGSTSPVDGAEAVRGRSAVPHRIPIENVDRLRLGGRTYAFLSRGEALTWDYRGGPTPLPGVVEALSMPEGELHVLASGEVTFTTAGSTAGATTTLPALASSRTLAATSNAYFGLRPDGTLAVHGRHGEAPALSGATDLAAIAPGEGTLVAVTRDGRALEFRTTDSTGQRYAAHVITLPPSGRVPVPPPQEQRDIPGWCEVELSVVHSESLGSLHAACLQLAGGDSEPCPPGEAEVRRELCRPQVGNAPGCVDGGPIWALSDTSEVALVWPAGAGGVSMLRGLGLVNAGTEDNSTIERAEIRSVSPLEALLEMSSGQEGCEGEGEDELCGQYETGRSFVVVRALPDGDLLRLDVQQDPEAMREAGGGTWAAPRVTLRATEVVVEACGGRTTRALPSGPAPTGDSATAPTAADVERAAAQCSAGWTRFGQGDLRAARSDFEAALALLARAGDERGRRTLGACRYNLGRVEEAEGRVDAARQLYRLSLDVRPNPTVEARLASLDGG